MRAFTTLRQPQGVDVICLLALVSNANFCATGKLHMQSMSDFYTHKSRQTAAELAVTDKYSHGCLSVMKLPNKIKRGN